MKKCGLQWMLSVCLVILLAVPASADLLVYEGFDMALNEGDGINGAAGTTSFGWAEPFRTTYNDPKFVADSLDLAGTGLRTRGGASRISTSGGNARILRNFSQTLGTTNGTYYVSFLFQDDGGQVTFDLSNGDWNGDRKCTIGREWSSGPVMLVVYDPAGNYQQEIASANEVHLYVVKLEFGSDADTVSVYVDPDVYSEEPAVPTASHTVSGQILISNIRQSCFNTNDIAITDEIRVGDTFADVLPGSGGALNISPKNGSTGVALDALLQWQVGNDPNELDGVEPWTDVAGYYVWFGEAGTDGEDPNLFLETPTMITATSYDPVIEADAVYYWQIEETFDNGQGGVYGPGDPNNVMSSVWSFAAVLTNPVITQQPVAVTRVEAGANSEISIVAQNTESYQWYHSADNVVGDDTEVGADSATLSLIDVQLPDEGFYYCVAGKTGAIPAVSTMSQVVINRLLASYQFENNLEDAVGSNDATVVGTIAYVDGIVTEGGQLYAADPNGSAYGALPEGCYPRAGIGNGLERFTYSAWVKLADSTQGGHLFGEFNTGSSTGMRFSVNVSGFDLSFYMRQEGGAAVVADTGGLNVDDNEWHLVALTYNGSQVVTYFDGLAVNSNGTAISNFIDWEFLPFPLLAVNGRGSIEGKFDGTVDDLQIFNYAMTPEQMAQMYYDVTNEKVCLYGNPAYDFNGNCVVDIADLALFAGDWLKNGFYPVD